MFHLIRGIANFAPIGAVIVFAFGLYQYRRAEAWKRTEFVAQLFKKFSDDPNCDVAMCLLSGEKRKIFYEVGGKWESYEYEYNVLCAALADQPIDKKLESDQLHMRESLDQFFVYIEQFDRAIQNNLVSDTEVYPYFGYWIGLLKGDVRIRKRMREDARLAVINYMNREEFDDAKNFFMDRSWDEKATWKERLCRLIQRRPT
jgi:hypothetical protein